MKISPSEKAGEAKTCSPRGFLASTSNSARRLEHEGHAVVGCKVDAAIGADRRGVMPLTAEPLLPVLLAAYSRPSNSRRRVVIDEIELAIVGHGRGHVSALVLLRPQDVRLVTLPRPAGSIAMTQLTG